MVKERYIWGVLRVFMGWIFLWPFFDKVFGLGLNTAKENAWITGNSPTTGFLLNATKGPFVSFFQSLVGNAWVDWLFMIGILLIGLALLLGIGMRIASASGILLMLLFWLAVLPPAHNPFLDEHIIYAIIISGLPIVKAGRVFGFGGWWVETSIVRRHHFLE